MKKACIVLLILTMFLCACEYPSDKWGNALAETTEPIKTVDSADNENTSESESSIDSKFPYEYTDRLSDNLKGGRSMLNSVEKEIYDEMLPYVLSYTPYKVDFRNEDYSYKSFSKATRAIYQDYPETWLYYSEEYEYDIDSCDEYGNPSIVYTGASCYFTIQYTWENIENFDKSAVDSYIKEINTRCDLIISQMPSGLSTKEKYTWLADYICDTTEYFEDEKYFYADGPLLYGKGICQSYAYAYQWLCQKAGLWCIPCHGYGYGVGHAWNVIMLDDGSTYYMDLTWADGVKDPSYYYFMTYEKCVNTRHTIEDGEWIANGE